MTGLSHPLKHSGRHHVSFPIWLWVTEWSEVSRAVASQNVCHKRRHFELHSGGRGNLHLDIFARAFFHSGTRVAVIWEETMWPCVSWWLETTDLNHPYHCQYWNCKVHHGCLSNHLELIKQYILIESDVSLTFTLFFSFTSSKVHPAFVKLGVQMARVSFP